VFVASGDTRATNERGPLPVAANGSANTYLQRAPSPSGLADVLDVILDKGLVIDAYVRVSLIGIEILTIDARIVIASVDTYLRFAEAVNRLDLTETEVAGLPELLEGDGEKVRGVLEDAGEAVKKTAGKSEKTIKQAVETATEKVQ
jgi:gas vesicle structural protein